MDSTFTLRPPGAHETRFDELCVRCGGCAVACVHEAIVLPESRDGPGLPEIRPAAAPCRLCMVCPSVCPTRALRSAPKRAVRMGTAVIDEARCIAHRGGVCDLCLEACPFPGVALVHDDDRPTIAAEACVGCGQCSHVCPTEPESVTIGPPLLVP